MLYFVNIQLRQLYIQNGKYKKVRLLMVINVNIKTILELKMFQQDYFLQLMKNLQIK